jgi:hypothetical protein
MAGISKRSLAPLYFSKACEDTGEYRRKGSGLPVKGDFRRKVSKDFRINKGLYLLVAPVILYYLVFHYIPIYGAQIAFISGACSATRCGSASAI